MISSFNTLNLFELGRVSFRKRKKNNENEIFFSNMSIGQTYDNVEP